jgi:hypothetical protein
LSPIPTPSHPPVPRPIDGHVGLLANRPGDLAAADDLERYDVVVLGQPSDWRSVAALRADDPTVKVFLYKNAMATSVDQVVHGHDRAVLTTGVGYDDAQSQHPDWFVRDSNGAQVPFADFAEYRWMDVGNESYQARWADDVRADVARFGADGVMIDDVNVGYGSHLPDGTTLAKYPTDAAWAAAQQRFLHEVTSRLHAAGVLSLANILQEPTKRGESLWKRWLGYVDGVIYEYWTKYGRDSTVRPVTDDLWERELRRGDDVARAGKLFVPITYGDMADRQAQRFARGSFLLTWSSGPAAQTWTASTPQDPWLGIDRLMLGKPTTPRRQVAKGVYLRHFSGGAIAVNGTSSSTVTVHLRDDYVDESGDLVSKVVLGPLDVLFLRRA